MPSSAPLATGLKKAKTLNVATVSAHAAISHSDVIKRAFLAATSG